MNPRLSLWLPYAALALSITALGLRLPAQFAQRLDSELDISRDETVRDEPAILAQSDARLSGAFERASAAVAARPALQWR